MGESQNHHQTSSSRLGMRSVVGGGEIVEVQGGHIVRSTGRKDRHSKVCTAKGPRDRRVRLSAHTAIQFYDVQDRLGYDRPSKAVDWLIKKAKAAIDELAELPAWNPTATVSGGSGTKTTSTTGHHHHQQQLDDEDGEFRFSTETLAATTTPTGTIGGSGTNKRGAAAATMRSDDAQHLQHGMAENPSHHPNNVGSGFLPPSLDSDSIADTIKSFFPMGASEVETTSSSSTLQFQGYPPDLLSRTSSSSHNQDLRLSLQSFQEPSMLLQPHQHQHDHLQQQGHSEHHQQQAVFAGPTGGNYHLGFDDYQGDIGRFQRMVAWNAASSGGGGGGGGGGGFVFSPPTMTQPLPILQPLFGQGQFLTQRGPLQSSNASSVRAWIDPAAISTIDDHHFPQFHHQQSVLPGVGFVASGGGFSGFRLPARIQGAEEEHDGIHNKPSSGSSDSRH